MPAINKKKVVKRAAKIRLCSVCGEEQFKTESGWMCENSHVGVDELTAGEIPSEHAKKQTEFTLTQQKTIGPYDSIDVKCVGVRIGQITLIHGQSAKDFIRLLQRAGIGLVVDKFQSKEGLK